jgi:uncharacterized membrane protein
MTTPTLIWGSPQWIVGALALVGISTLFLLWSYSRARAPRGVLILAAILKAVGFTALALSLVEPLLTGSRPRRGANAFVVLADNSQSLRIRDDSSSQTRGEWIQERLQKEAAWRTRLGQDFDVRTYVFDSHIRAEDGFDRLDFDGTSSALTTSLSMIAKRFRGLPLAGVLVFTDGNATDAEADANLDWSQLPPVYPVAPPSRSRPRDVGVTRVSVSQTNFESAPAVLRADVSAAGFAGAPIIAVVTDEEGNEVERQQIRSNRDDKPLSFRFQFRPEKKGVNFYRVHAFAAVDEAAYNKGKPSEISSREQTFANNSRLSVIDQGGGPYRVLYVSGRPNWEFKFLRRAISEDDQVQLVGLLRIAKRQPKFDFRDPQDRKNSQLFTNFDNIDSDTAESRDQAVLVRLGTLDDIELRDGFPKTAEELDRYHAIVLDDLEAAFFAPDQMTLIRNFVNQRGGGLLMLGGPDSFTEGKYDRTAIGELMPVYLNKPFAGAGDGEFRLALTREGWLQPWVRTRKTEEEERSRLAGMPAFQTLSRVGSIKPGAVVLSQVVDTAGTTFPALVAQQFGKGRVAALLVGDIWRWAIRREDSTETDIDRAWRQTVRWLVSDVPGRVEVAVKPKDDTASPAVEISARVRDAEYRALDNAKVALRLLLPDGNTLTLDAEPDGRESGSYSARYVPKQTGGYRVVASATAPDGSTVGEREAGWAAQPSADEFARLETDDESLKSIARKTKGEVVDGDRLDAFVASLNSRAAPITEPWTSPLWHHPLYYLIAIACLAAEWGVRRVNGLA